MKSIIKLDELELIVNSKNDKVESFVGDESIKELIEEYFDKSLEIGISTKNKIGLHLSSSKVLKPGNKNYIKSVLLKIEDELNFRTEYNIK